MCFILKYTDYVIIKREQNSHAHKYLNFSDSLIKSFIHVTIILYSDFMTV